MFAGRDGVPRPVPRNQGGLHGGGGILHAKTDPVVTPAVGLRVRHIIVGVEALDPVGPAACEKGGRAAAAGLEHAGQLAVAVVGEPGGVAGVAVMAGVGTQARPRPPLAQVDHLGVSVLVLVI